MSIDLHLHTHHSDGTWTPSELVEHAVRKRMKHIAITDHDTTAGIAEAVNAANGRLEVIPAVEINTIYHGPDGKLEDVHILGHFIDPQNSELQRILQLQQEARHKHVLDCIETLSAASVAITVESVRKFAGKGSIGRPHITQAIVEAGGAPDLVQAYERYMMRSSPYYTRRKSVSPTDAIAAINAAGGIASIAHPGKGEHIDALILHLREHGLRGIETFHRVHSLKLVRHFIRLANRNGMQITGGSDCHGPYEDYPATLGSISIPVEVVKDLRAALG